jgi:hypothetical protein
MIPYDDPAALCSPLLSIGPQIVRTALELQERGWQIALLQGGFHAASTERLLAGHLKTGMVAAVKEIGVFAIIQEAVGTRSSREPPEADGEADIALWFYRSFDHNDPHLLVECKRVDEANNFLIREYVNEGIDRFLKGHYRPGENGCFMTGFVIRGSPKGIVNRVNKYLTKKGRIGCHLKHDPAHADIGFVFTSNHAEPGLLHIANVKHSFLCVPAVKVVEPSGPSGMRLA